MPLSFADEDWDRPHGFEKVEGDQRHVWDSPCMMWRVFEGRRQVGSICPDHERAMDDPAYRSMLALLRSKRSPRGYLHLVKT